MQENDFIEVLKDIIFPRCWTMPVEHCWEVSQNDYSWRKCTSCRQGKWRTSGVSCASRLVAQRRRLLLEHCRFFGGWFVPGNRWTAAAQPHRAAYSFPPTAGRNRKEQELGDNLGAEIKTVSEGEQRKLHVQAKQQEEFIQDSLLAGRCPVLLGSSTSASGVVTWEGKHLSPKHPPLHPPFFASSTAKQQQQQTLWL